MNPVSKLVTKNGRTYIEYLGNPYLFYGVQIRIDHLMLENIDDESKWEELFAKTKEMNFHSIIAQSWWRYIEKEKEQYDFYDIGLLIKWCEKYDLDLQLTWLGSNVCGEPFMTPWVGKKKYGELLSLPKDIMDDPVTYPRNANAPEHSPDYSGENFINREKKVFKALLEYLEENDKNCRVSMIQVENEPDNVQGIEGLDWSDPAKIYPFLWSGGQADSSIAMMETLGKMVKESGHKTVTRANFIDVIYKNPYSREQHYLKKILQGEGVDLVGIDNYSGRIEDSNELMDFINEEAGGKPHIAHTPECCGSQGNTINMLMLAFSRGEGRLIYEIKTANFIPEEYNTSIYRQSSSEWIERDGTVDVYVYSGVADYGFMKEGITGELRDFNELVYKASCKLASLPIDSIAAFNIENAEGPYEAVNTVCGRYHLSYFSPTGGEAMAMCDENGDLILLSLYKDSAFKINGKTLSGEGSTGYFTTDGKWIEQGTIDLSGSSVTLPGVTCMKISAESIL